MSDHLSVVIPTHERPAALARLLASILPPGPGLGSLEVVVVDDGSAPQTYDDLARAHPGVTWFWEPRSGPATARNRGWREATGDVVVFVDDDCVLAADTLARLRDATGVAEAVGATIQPLQSGRLIADFMHAEHLVTHKVQDGEVRWLVTACVAVRRTALELLEGFDESLTHPGGEDVDLSFRLREAGLRMDVCREAVAYHDHRAGLVQLARTYYRHGTGQRRLTARHPERRTDLARSMRSRLSPAAWAATYRSYRAEQGPLASAAFVTLRLLMMVPWLVGAVSGSPGGADAPRRR